MKLKYMMKKTKDKFRCQIFVTNFLHNYKSMFEKPLIFNRRLISVEKREPCCKGKGKSHTADACGGALKLTKKMVIWLEGQMEAVLYEKWDIMII